MSSSPTISQTEDNNRYRFLKLIALLTASFFAYLEIQATWITQQSSSKTYSLIDIFTITLYIVLFLVGFVSLVLGFLCPNILTQWSNRFNKQTGLRWGIITGVILIFTYIHLYSPWQHTIPGPWSQLIAAVGISQIILFFADPNCKQKIRLRETFLALIIFVFPRVSQEARDLFQNALAYRIVTLIGFAVVVIGIFLSYSPYGNNVPRKLINWRKQLGWVRILLIALLYLTPIIYRYLASPETYIVYADTRFAILLIALWLVTYLASNDSDRLILFSTLMVSVGVLAFTSFLANASLLVINYPFSLSWSEGNRFYDYSLMFAQSLYKHNGYIENPYASPGRYGLWGALFLLQGLPIWVHRLWNLTLYTLPVLLFATLLTRKLESASIRYGSLLWITLFLTLLSPLHPPFIVASVIMIAFAFDQSFIRRGIAIAIAGYYVAISRFTWAFAPGAIGLLVDLLFYYPTRKGHFVRRLFPSIVLLALGILPGLLSNLGTFQSTAASTLSDLSSNSGTVQSTIQSTAVTGQQPLLWYRLLPNATLGTGILLLVLYYTLPLLLIIAWLMFSGRWQLDWVQKLAIWGVLAGFFGFGLVVSAKIGGGGDLHNMDMYLVTILVLTVFGLMSQNNKFTETRWPVWVVGLIAFLIFLPIYPFTPLSPDARYDQRLDLPNSRQTAEALSAVQRNVDKYAQTGEVLFMDQRQLLTFGYIRSVSFVSEYEKKYMMDQAMASNATYFQPYYQDLANKRFALILTEPLRADIKQTDTSGFTEENNAWVYWVSNPTLCFYEPLYISKKTNVELLIPKKQTPTECEKYIK